MTSNENGEQLNNSVQPRQNVTSRSRARRNGGVKRGLSESNSGTFCLMMVCICMKRLEIRNQDYGKLALFIGAENIYGQVEQH